MAFRWKVKGEEESSDIMLIIFSFKQIKQYFIDTIANLRHEGWA